MIPRWWHSSTVRKSIWIFKSHQYCTHDSISYTGIITTSHCLLIDRLVFMESSIGNSAPLHLHDFIEVQIESNENFQTPASIPSIVLYNCGVVSSCSEKHLINNYRVLFTYLSNDFIIVFVVYIDFYEERFEEFTRGKSSKFVSNDCPTRLGRPPNYWYQSGYLLLEPFRCGRSPTTVIFASVDMRFTVNYLMDDLNEAWDRVKYDMGEIISVFVDWIYAIEYPGKFLSISLSVAETIRMSFEIRESFAQYVTVKHTIRNDGDASLQWYVCTRMRINLVMSNVSSRHLQGVVPAADSPN